VEIISLPWRNYAAHLGDNFSASLLRRLTGSGFDVLIQDELNHPSLFFLNQKLRKLVSYPIVSIVHHLRSSELRLAWQNKFYHLPERAYLRSVDSFVFNSQTTRGVIEDVLGESRPHVVAYPAGNRLNPQIDAAEIAARARADTPLKIAFLGSVIPRKNLHTLLDALALLEESWQLEVIGRLDVEPKYVKSLRQQIARLGLDEAFGIAYLEGMSYGLPAIGGRDGAAHEIITHGLDGFLVDTNDAKALAAHLHELADDREKLIQMSFAARERYSAHPTWDESAAKIRAFLLKRLKG
jgi:glycosyltransferase involved in cell wall biosynthesis